MAETEDTWPEIPGYPGYLASPTGEIKRTSWIDTLGRRRKTSILAENFPARGSTNDRSRKALGPYVRVFVAGKAKMALICELVAITFRNYDRETEDITFADGNPLNAHLSNLVIVPLGSI